VPLTSLQYHELRKSALGYWTKKYVPIVVVLRLRESSLNDSEFSR
jgi:hypothetical protein